MQEATDGFDVDVDRGLRFFTDVYSEVEPSEYCNDCKVYPPRVSIFPTDQGAVSLYLNIKAYHRFCVKIDNDQDVAINIRT